MQFRLTNFDGSKPLKPVVPVVCQMVDPSILMGRNRIPKSCLELKPPAVINLFFLMALGILTVIYSLFLNIHYTVICLSKNMLMLLMTHGAVVPTKALQMSRSLCCTMKRRNPRACWCSTLEHKTSGCFVEK